MSNTPTQEDISSHRPELEVKGHSHCIQNQVKNIPMATREIEHSVSKGKRPVPVTLLASVFALLVTTFIVSGCFVVPVPIIISISWIEGAEIHNNSDAVDPTWEQLKMFLYSDKTDELRYSGSFVCGDFAVTLHDNAEAAGIKAAIVAVDFGDSSAGHALNAFNTTDKGLLYIDDVGTSYGIGCSCDKIATVVVGKDYTPPSIFPCPGYQDTWGTMGKVTDMEIRW